MDYEKALVRTTGNKIHVTTLTCQCNDLLSQSVLAINDAAKTLTQNIVS